MILHHHLEVGKFDDSRLVILSEVCQVGIATDDVIGSDSVGKCKKIEVFRVADCRRADIGLNGDELTEGIDDGQQVIEVVGTKMPQYQRLVSMMTFMGYFAYLTAFTSSMISSSLIPGAAGRLLTKRSSNCSRVSACQPNFRMSSRKSDQSPVGTFT